MAIPASRAIFACAIPAIIVILSYIWFKRKKHVANGPSTGSTGVSQATYHCNAKSRAHLDASPRETLSNGTAEVLLRTAWRPATSEGLRPGEDTPAEMVVDIAAGSGEGRVRDKSDVCAEEKAAVSECSDTECVVSASGTGDECAAPPGDAVDSVLDADVCSRPATEPELSQDVESESGNSLPQQNAPPVADDVADIASQLAEQVNGCVTVHDQSTVPEESVSEADSCKEVCCVDEADADSVDRSDDVQEPVCNGRDQDSPIAAASDSNDSRTDVPADDSDSASPAEMVQEPEQDSAAASPDVKLVAETVQEPEQDFAAASPGVKLVAETAQEPEQDCAAASPGVKLVDETVQEPEQDSAAASPGVKLVTETVQEPEQDSAAASPGVKLVAETVQEPEQDFAAASPAVKLVAGCESKGAPSAAPSLGLSADEPELQKLVNGNSTSAYGSASHSPADGLESPTASNYSDLHSEGSSDSGKGGSDIHTPSADGSSGNFPFTPLQVYEFELPQDLCGRLIGQRGRYVNLIKNKSHANISIKRHPFNPDLKLCAVIGTEEDISAALVLIRKRFPLDKFPVMSMLQVNSPLMNGIPVPDTLQLHLPEGITCDVILSSLVNAGHFFVQQPTHPTYSSLSRLDQFMLACYINGLGAPELPAPVEAGIICAASTMGGWYRAQIVFVYPDSDECEVKFVDYGGYSRESISSLRQIRSDFMTLPFQASECFLANVSPIDENQGWALEASSCFEEMAQGQILQAQIVAYSDEGIPYVHLYRVQGVMSTFINQELVNCGQARWIENQA